MRDLSGKFAQADIAYMLNGSFAMNYYAQPRMTRDLDVVVQLTTQDADARREKIYWRQNMTQLILRGGQKNWV